MTGESWQQYAECRGLTTLFYVEIGESTAPAKAVCATCPVTQQCLQYALDHHERFGIWGGHTTRERWKMYRGRAA
jgi:WhiB family redox-sensing transcriptional regulator